jgi:catechol 2,3-dioxygenase-like lactoylglutathione lyase family enzyme
MVINISIAVVSLWAEDVPATAHFYREAVGLNIVPHHAGDRPHFDLDGSILTIIRGRPALPPDPEPRFPAVAFSVPDLEAAIEKLRLHGVEPALGRGNKRRRSVGDVPRPGGKPGGIGRI